jgi:hypothetical protein
MSIFRSTGKQSLFYAAFWLIYCILTFCGILNHETNRDEAQAWLIVRDLDIPGIFSQLSIKGHPGLWYMILLPFAKLGFPYFTMSLVHWVIGVISCGTILFRAPLSKPIKLLFVFSYFMIFEYIIPARNYSLTILMLSLISIFYKQRFDKPLLFSFLIFLLFNTNTHSFGAAFALTVLYFAEGYKNQIIPAIKYGLLIMTAGLISVIIQLVPSDQVQSDQTVNSSFLPGNLMDCIWNILTGIQNSFIPVHGEYEELKVALVFSLFFILLLIIHFKKIYPFLFLFISSSWLFYIFCAKLSGSWRHEGLILVFSFFSLWIATFYNDRYPFLKEKAWNELKNMYTGFLMICLGISVMFGLSCLRKEFQYDFSGSEKTAGFILKNNLQDKEIACYPSWRASALSPYLPNTKLWFVERKEYGTFFTLDSVFKKDGNDLSHVEVISRLHEKYPQGALLLLNEPLSLREQEQFTSKLLFRNTEFIWGVNDEIFFLYEIKFMRLLSH